VHCSARTLQALPGEGEAVALARTDSTAS